MTRWLLDTNVLSELRRLRPHRNVTSFVADQGLDDLYVSEVSFAEIRFGIEIVSDESRRAMLATWLETELRPMFENRVLDVSEDVLVRWRHIIEAGRKRGQTYSHPDVLIAATAALHGTTVVSRNTAEFIAAGAATFDPWTGRTSIAKAP